MSGDAGADATPSRAGGLGRAAASFHRDEQGLSTVEILLIIFVAALILIGFLKIFFPEVLQRVKGKVMELLDMEVTQ